MVNESKPALKKKTPVSKEPEVKQDPVKDEASSQKAETAKGKKSAPKKVKKAKTEPAKVEKPAKPARKEAKAIAKNVKVTPRKARLVIDLVRGKSVKEALGILANVNRAASVPVSKLIKSASANATNNFGLDEEKLYVAEIYATDGLRMKRFLPRAKGSASGLIKRSSHLTVVVKMKEEA